MGDDEDGAGIFAQVMLQPGDAFGIEMVGGLVQQQQIGLAQQQLGQGDAAPFAARQVVDRCLARRAAQGIHGLIDLGVEVPQVLVVDDVLQLGHLIGRLVGIVHGQFVVAVEDGLLGRHPLHDVAEDVQRRVELGFLRQVAGCGALGQPCLALKFVVEAGHDAQQRRLARAVGAEHADLGVRVEGQMNVVEHLLAAGIGL